MGSNSRCHQPAKLLFLTLTAVATAAATTSAATYGCSDPAAVNYDPLSPATPAARFNNSGCVYSCGTLCGYFNVDCTGALCLIDTGAESNWTLTNTTLYATLGTSLIVQGRVDSMNAEVGRTQLSRRIESTTTGGATVILVQRRARTPRTPS